MSTYALFFISRNPAPDRFLVRVGDRNVYVRGVVAGSSLDSALDAGDQMREDEDLMNSHEIAGDEDDEET